MKRFAKGLILLNILALAVTALAVWLLDRRSAVAMFDIATYVGLGMGALGALMFFGSTTGSSASTTIAASVADQPSRMMDALWGDLRYIDRILVCFERHHLARDRMAAGLAVRQQRLKPTISQS